MISFPSREVDVDASLVLLSVFETTSETMPNADVDLPSSSHLLASKDFSGLSTDLSHLSESSRRRGNG